MMSILKLLLSGATPMDATDGRLTALRRYCLDAFGTRHEVTVFALRSDQWAWLNGRDSEGKPVSLDVRVHEPSGGATAALAAALQCLADQRRARAGQP